MKYVTIIAILLMLLTGCAKQAAYKNKGISYIEKPQQEIENIISFPISHAEKNIIAFSSEPVLYNDLLYMQINTRYSTGKGRVSYSTIYCLDPNTMTVRDSLVLKEEGKIQYYPKVIPGEEMYFVGTKDSVCVIVKTDSHLKIKGEFSTGLRTQNLMYAALRNGAVRLVVGDIDKSATLYDLDKNMKPIRKRLLLKNSNASTLHKDILWFNTADEHSMITTRFDLATDDPVPIMETYNIQIPMNDTVRRRKFHFIPGDSTLYISTSHIEPESGYQGKLFAINIADKSMKERVFDGVFTFDILERNGKTYLYNSQEHGKNQVLSVTELGKDLSDISKKLSFYISKNSNSARYIMAWKDTKVILTGTYFEKTGTKSSMDIPKMGMMKFDDFVDPNFIAAFDLK